jgi:hypothetical protein
VPTNKLWLEHTEQAAWQSVDALREKVVLLEQRQQRLVPPVDNWRELLDALDAAKNEHAIPGDGYGAMIRGLVERITVAEGRVRELEQAAPPLTTVSVSLEGPTFRSSRRKQSSPEDDENDEPGTDAPVAGEARLFREIRARYQRLVHERGRDPQGLLADIEARLDELPELDPGELADAAVDLAALALVVQRRGGFDE